MATPVRRGMLSVEDCAITGTVKEQNVKISEKRIVTEADTTEYTAPCGFSSFGIQR
jgi:hypothetical protein